MTTKTNKQLRSEFEEKLQEGFMAIRNGLTFGEYKSATMLDFDKALQLRDEEKIKAAKQEALEEVEDMLKYDLFPVQIKLESPRYWDGYIDTIKKISSLISSLKKKS